MTKEEKKLAILREELVRARDVLQRMTETTKTEEATHYDRGVVDGIRYALELMTRLTET